MKTGKKKSQIWIETVLYTAIGLAIIGLLLAVARPKIVQTQEEFVIKQTISAINELDNKIVEVKSAVGNRRLADFQISKGELFIDGENNKIEWQLTSTSTMFSEPGVIAYIGDIRVFTKRNADKYDITLTLDYSGKTKLTVNEANKLATLQAAKIPYKLAIENVGEEGGLVKVDISIS